MSPDLEKLYILLIVKPLNLAFLCLTKLQLADELYTKFVFTKMFDHKLSINFITDHVKIFELLFIQMLFKIFLRFLEDGRPNQYSSLFVFCNCFV